MRKGERESPQQPPSLQAKTERGTRGGGAPYSTTGRFKTGGHEKGLKTKLTGRCNKKNRQWGPTQTEKYFNGGKAGNLAPWESLNEAKR